MNYVANKSGSSQASKRQGKERSAIEAGTQFFIPAAAVKKLRS